MKRTTSGESAGFFCKPTVTELKPLPTPREHIHNEKIEKVVGSTHSGEPIYTSKSFVVVGNAPAFVTLPYKPSLNSISADPDMIVMVAHAGLKLFIYKSFNFGAGLTETAFDLPSVALETALLSNDGQRTLIVAGDQMLQTVSVPMRPWAEIKATDVRQTEGAFSNIVYDNSNKCCHVIYRSGEWLQVLADGQIVERLPLPMVKMGTYGRLLAADIMRGIFLYQTGTSLTLSHGVVEFPIGIYVNEEERVVALWGKSGFLHLQIGTADVVPALNTLHMHTGTVVDTIFPTGVAPGTTREVGDMAGTDKTLVYNNGIYVLTDREAD